MWPGCPGPSVISLKVTVLGSSICPLSPPLSVRPHLEVTHRPHPTPHPSVQDTAADLSAHKGRWWQFPLHDNVIVGNTKAVVGL